MHRVLFSAYSFLLAFAILGMASETSAQDNDSLNQTDAQGRKHGLWKKYEGGTLVYRGQFDHGRPVGIFERYYEEGSLQAKILYGVGGKATAKIYYPETGDLMAEGNYIDQERDSVWNFYGEDGGLASRESYDHGKKHGMTTIFFGDGSVSEEVLYRDNVKNGLWKQYYPNGHLQMEATVVDGVSYEGKFTTYYDDGIKRTEGKYVDGNREGSWYEFNDDGSVRVITVYRNGQPAGVHYRNGTFEEYWPDDVLRSKYTYVEGKRNGNFEEWYNQGRWQTEMRVDDTGTKYPVQTLEGAQMRLTGRYNRGERDGEFVYYNDDGTVWKREIYDNGELKNTKTVGKGN